MRRTLSLFICTLGTFWGWSQTKSVTRSNQQWVQYYGQFKPTNKWTIGLDGGFRWRNGEKLLYIVRTGLGYQLNSRLRISAGFATQRTFQHDQLATVEYRPYEELLYVLVERKVSMQHRLRVEERFFDHLLTNTHDYNFRYRYQFTCSVPIVKLSKGKPEKRLAILVSDEVFFNSGTDIVYNSFDRNRFIIGPAILFSESVSVAISYMYQFAKLNQPAAFNSDHVLWLTVRHTLMQRRNVDFD